MPSQPSSSISGSPLSPSSTYTGIVSPLQIRKKASSTKMVSPTSPSDVSPVTPGVRTASSHALVPPVPSSRFSSSTRESSQQNSSKSHKPAPSARSLEQPQKAVVDPADYSGLQVDTRKPLPQPPPEYDVGNNPYGAQMAREKHNHFQYFPPSHPANGVNHPSNQNQNLGISRANTLGTLGSAHSRDILDDKFLANEQFDRQQAANAEPKGFIRSRKRLWTFVGVIALALLVLVAVVVGAVVGTQRRAQSNASSAASATSSPTSTSTAPLITPTAAPDVYDNQLPPGAVHANAPLAAIQFTTNSSEKNSQAGVQNYELYYNTHCGNTAQLQNTGSWRNPNGLIFTDAINGSGMAAMTYWNATRSMHETTLFYVGADNTLRDKRLDPDQNTFLPAKLIQKKIAIGAVAADTSSSNQTESVNDYAIAVAFSEAFPQGPGARLFYHATNASRHYLQEMIYTLASDSWDYGTTIDGVLPTSQLSIVADDANAVLRLMFATDAGNADNATAPPILQEYYLSLASADATWTKGQARQNLLQHPWSQFALAVAAQTAYLYHVTPVNDSSPALRIREVTLPNANSSDPIREETAETVAVPDWLSSDTGGRVPTMFAPLGAVGGAGYMNVFFAHGTVDAAAGFTKLSYVSRLNGQGWGSGSQASAVSDLPLNSKCAKPDV